MHSHRRITQHRLRPRRRNCHMRRLTRLRVDHRVLKVPKVALHRLVKYLIIAHGGLQERVPIHEPLTAIDFSVLEQPEEPLSHCPRALIVEREPRALPITTATKLTKLAENAGFILILPFPNALHEPFAAQVVARFLLFLEQPPLDHRLRRNAGMIGAWHPQRIKPLHPLHADENILQRIIQRVPNVKCPRHIRRRNHDRIWRTRIIGLGMKVTAILPEAVPLLLRGVVIVM